MKWMLLVALAQGTSGTPHYAPYKANGEVRLYDSQAQCRQAAVVLHAAIEKTEGHAVPMRAKCQREGQ